MNNKDSYYKLQLNSIYGRFGKVPSDRYTFVGGFRGYGKVYSLYLKYGYDYLVGKLIRLQLRSPFWRGGEVIHQKLLCIHRDEQHERDLETFLYQLCDCKFTDAATSVRYYNNLRKKAKSGNFTYIDTDSVFMPTLRLPPIDADP